MVTRVASLIRRLMRLRGKDSRSAAPGQEPLRPAIDREAWATAAQSGELDYHKRHNFRAQDQVWWAVVVREWKLLGLEPTGWEGKFIIDVGAGSRLRSLYFEGARLAVLEPLADRYMSEVEWHDLDKADEVYSVPAEQFVPELEGRADLIVSINALDHGYDFAQGARNIRRYLKPDGTALLSFDMHHTPDHMHPLVLNDEIVRKIFADAGFEIEKSEEGRRYHGTEGPPAIHYWLRPV